MDADTFFRRVADTVSSLETSANPETVSVALAEATMKRYVADPSKRVRLQDLVIREATRVRVAIIGQDTEAFSSALTPESIGSKLTWYERQTDVLRALLATGSYWDDGTHDDLWERTLVRLGDLPRLQNFYVQESWDHMRWYPALLAIYAARLGALVRDRYDALYRLLYVPQVNDLVYRGRHALLARVAGYAIDNHAESVSQPNAVSGYPTAYYLANQPGLWDSVRQHFYDDLSFQRCFDRFEYLLGLVVADIRMHAGGRGWGPPGYFGWRHRMGYRGMADGINAEVEAMGSNWLPLRAKFFDGSIDRLQEVQAQYHRSLPVG